MRKKLKLKIKGTYGSISNFSKSVGVSVTHLSYICSGSRAGALDVWFKIQKALGIPDEEMWGYIKESGGLENE